MQNIRLKVLWVLIVNPMLCVFAMQKQEYQLVTVAFYNLENLFDTCLLYTSPSPRD